jgi:putative ABC transport system substrate-binding protein
VKRREFITLLGGAASWPVAAQAQQPLRRIGVLLTFAVDEPETKAGITVFQQGLQQAGWSDGRNVQIEYRVAEGDADRIRQNAAELVAAAPDVIFAVGTANVGRLL